MAKVERIRLYPVKGFGGADVTDVEVLDKGTLAYDREFALHDGDTVLNGKDTDAVHGFETELDSEKDELTVESPEGETLTVKVSDEGACELTDWLGDIFDDATVKRDASFGFVDRRERLPSVSVVSTATLREVASWFDGIDADGIRRRLRANVEVSGVSAFWEDRFVGDDASDFRLGGVRFEGAEPCVRCVVPTRDPDTGETTEGFRERFIEKRRETFPEFADEDCFDHGYTVMLIARVAEEDRGSVLRVGDSVSVCGS